MKEIDKKLQEIQFYLKDISIIKQNNDTELLFVLLCHNQDDSTQLLSILESQNIDLKVWLANNGNYNFSLTVNDSDGEILIPTKYNTKNYHPLTWLNTFKGKSYLTSGVTEGQGRLFYSQLQIPLGNIYIQN